MLRRNSLLVLTVLGLSPIAAIACETSPYVHANGLPQTSTQSSAATDNFGYYVWNESAAGWILVQSGYQPSAESVQMQADDIPLSPSQLGGGDGGGGGGGGWDHEMPQSDCEPTDLPPVVVTGIGPSGFGVLLVYRPSSWGGGGWGGSGGGFGKRRAGKPVQADKNVTCDRGLLDRQGAARDAIKKLGGLIKRGGTYLVTYAPGHHQPWTVTNKYATDLGLQPAGECFTS